MLPPIIEQLAGIIGIEAVNALMEARLLGYRQRIGRTQDCEWWREWADVIGDGPTDAVMRQWGGDHVYFPACSDAIRNERNRQIVARYDTLLASGLSARRAIRVMCREYGLADRTLEKIVNRPTVQPCSLEQQLNLF